MAYFERVFGFAEASYGKTREHLLRLCRFENGPRGRERCVFESSNLDAGWFYAPSVSELRDEVTEAVDRFNTRYPGYLDALERRHQQEGRLRGIAHVVGESLSQHVRFPGALFQAASQFNLLEFIHADVLPEDGIANYIYDATQGPACAVACLPGTAYRNYLLHPRFFRHAGSSGGDAAERGQQEHHQLSMLEGVTQQLTQSYPAMPEASLPELPAVSSDSLFTIRNGYFSCNARQQTALTARMRQLQARLGGASPLSLFQSLAPALRIGIVEDTTVTAARGVRGCEKEELSKPLDLACLPKVTQTYNSALSLSAAPCGHPEQLGIELLAQTVLYGTYEATLLAGVLHTLRAYERAIANASLRRITPTAAEVASDASLPLATPPPIFLTKVGGGVFNNPHAWVKAAMNDTYRSVCRYGVPMDVQLVHFRTIDRFYCDGQGA